MSVRRLVCVGTEVKSVLWTQNACCRYVMGVALCVCVTWVHMCVISKHV